MTFCGTVEYMPPELVKGEAYSMAVDWWSFGVLVYEMLTTKTPFFSDQGRRVIFAGIVARVFHSPILYTVYAYCGALVFMG